MKGKILIMNGPSLTTPNFANHFIFYTFTSQTCYVVVLTQLNDQQIEAPISFFSYNFQGAELNYSDVEKQAFVVFKYVKHFRPFLLKTHNKIIVPFSTVRQLLMQKEVGEEKGKLGKNSTRI